jgi:hypothetical protein
MSPRMLLISRIFTGVLVVYVMGLIGYGTHYVFSADLTQLSAATATAYGALVGIPGAGLYGLYKWARSDRAREREQ